MKYPGIYIHIPFCFKKCPYCDFYSVIATEDVQNAFVQALLNEITEIACVHTNKIYDTVYIGGGTPNVISCDNLQRIMTQIRNSFILHSNTEITLEINPEFLKNEDLILYKQLGINRLSLGCQSFIDSELQFLGRIHNSLRNHEAVNLIRNHDFKNLSCDLIAGLPDQTIQNVEYNLEQFLAVRPEHLSVYTLTMEENTPMYRDAESGHISYPDPDLVREIYLTVHNRLISAGYNHYEVSNYCLPGYKSRHNTKYWDESDYLGFGPSAHSKSGRTRSWNGRNLQAYILGNRETGQEFLSDQEWLEEKIMLGLRTSDGLDLDELSKLFRPKVIHELLSDLNRDCGSKLISVNRSRITVQPEGWVILDTIIEKLSEKMVR